MFSCWVLQSPVLTSSGDIFFMPKGARLAVLCVCMGWYSLSWEGKGKYPRPLQQEPHWQVLPWEWTARGVWKSNTATAIQGKGGEVSLHSDSWAQECCLSPQPNVTTGNSSPLLSQKALAGRGTMGLGGLRGMRRAWRAYLLRKVGHKVNKRMRGCLN